MTKQVRISGVTWLVAALAIATSVWLSGCDRGSKTISADAKTGNCPVCHMKVNSGDAWESEILFKGGAKVMFESPVDMFQFYLDPGKYEVTDAQKDKSNIEQVFVTDYQTNKHVDARKAALVYKSKVSGPMGSDFVAFESADAAATFAKTQGGSIVKMDQVTGEMLRDLRK